LATWLEPTEYNILYNTDKCEGVELCRERLLATIQCVSCESQGVVSECMFRTVEILESH